MSREHILAYPVTMTLTPVGGSVREETVESVTVRRPKGKDIMAAEAASDGNPTRQAIAMIAQLTGLDFKVVAEMDATDIEAIGEIIAGFSPPGRPTGETSSAT